MHLYPASSCGAIRGLPRYRVALNLALAKWSDEFLGLREPT